MSGTVEGFPVVGTADIEARNRAVAQHRTPDSLVLGAQTCVRPIVALGEAEL